MGCSSFSTTFLLEQLWFSVFISSVCDSAGSLNPSEERKCHGTLHAHQPGNFKGEVT